jgi:hypothetical protein
MKIIITFILFVVGISALLTGLAMMSSPDGNLVGLNFNILKTTPFKDFLIPGLLLFVLVGLVNILALFFQIINNPKRFYWALTAGIITVIWVTSQYLIIGHLLQLDIAYFLASFILICIALQQQGKSLI